MKKVIILGAGYSINEGIDLGLWQKIKGKETWSLNSVFKVMPYLPTREIWVDSGFFQQNIQDLQIIAEKGVLLYAKSHTKYNPIKKINQVDGFREEKNADKGIYIGEDGFSGMFALSLAIKENYDEIYLLGYDFGVQSINDTNTHFYQNRIKELNIYSTGATRPDVFLHKDGRLKSGIENFKYYLQFPNKIFNVSKNSNISYFEKISYETFFLKTNE